eukprot:gene12004-14674_t
MAAPITRNLRRLALAPLLCMVLAWALMRTKFADQFELRTLDWRTQWRAHFQAPPDDRLAVILYDDNTDAQISWPPDRKVHGDLMDLMSFTPPAVVVWDVILDATREGPGDA